MGRFDDVPLTSKRKMTFGIVGLSEEEVSLIRRLLELSSEQEPTSTPVSVEDTKRIARAVLAKMG